MIDSYQKDPNYTPTPEEIKQECEKIQAEWTCLERQRRIVFGKTKPVELRPMKTGNIE